VTEMTLEKFHESFRRFFLEVNAKYHEYVLVNKSQRQIPLAHGDVVALRAFTQRKFSDEFSQALLPRKIAAGFDLAESFVHSDKIVGAKLFNKAIAALIVSAGGVALVFSIITALGIGTGLLTSVIVFLSGMNPAAYVTMPIAVVTVLAGIYLFVFERPPEARASLAYDALRKSMEAWQEQCLASAGDGAGKINLEMTMENSEETENVAEKWFQDLEIGAGRYVNEVTEFVTYASKTSYEYILSSAKGGTDIMKKSADLGLKIAGDVSDATVKGVKQILKFRG